MRRADCDDEDTASPDEDSNQLAGLLSQATASDWLGNGAAESTSGSAAFTPLRSADSGTFENTLPVLFLVGTDATASCCSDPSTEELIRRGDLVQFQGGEYATLSTVAESLLLLCGPRRSALSQRIPSKAFNEFMVQVPDVCSPSGQPLYYHKNRPDMGIFFVTATDQTHVQLMRDERLSLADSSKVERIPFRGTSGQAEAVWKEGTGEIALTCTARCDRIDGRTVKVFTPSDSDNAHRRRVVVDNATIDLEQRGQFFASLASSGDVSQSVKLHIACKGARDLLRIQTALLPILEQMRAEGKIGAYKTLDPNWIEPGSSSTILSPGVDQGAKGFTIYLNPEQAVEVARVLDEALCRSDLADATIRTGNVADQTARTSKSGRVSIERAKWQSASIAGNEGAVLIDSCVIDKLKDKLPSAFETKTGALTEEGLRQLERECGIKPKSLVLDGRGRLCLRDGSIRGFGQVYVSEGTDSAPGQKTLRRALYALYDLVGLDPAAVYIESTIEQRATSGYRGDKPGAPPSPILSILKEFSSTSGPKANGESAAKTSNETTSGRAIIYREGPDKTRTRVAEAVGFNSSTGDALVKLSGKLPSADAGLLSETVGCSEPFRIGNQVFVTDTNKRVLLVSGEPARLTHDPNLRLVMRDSILSLENPTTVKMNLLTAEAIVTSSEFKLTESEFARQRFILLARTMSAEEQLSFQRWQKLSFAVDALVQGENGAKDLERMSLTPEQRRIAGLLAEQIKEMRGIDLSDSSVRIRAIVEHLRLNEGAIRLALAYTMEGNEMMCGEYYCKLGEREVRLILRTPLAQDVVSEVLDALRRHNGAPQPVAIEVSARGATGGAARPELLEVSLTGATDASTVRLIYLHEHGHLVHPTVSPQEGYDLNQVRGRCIVANHTLIKEVLLKHKVDVAEIDTAIRRGRDCGKFVGAPVGMPDYVTYLLSGSEVFADLHSIWANARLQGMVNPTFKEALELARKQYLLGHSLMRYDLLQIYEPMYDSARDVFARIYGPLIAAADGASKPAVSTEDRLLAEQIGRAVKSAISKTGQSIESMDRAAIGDLLRSAHEDLPASDRRQGVEKLIDKVVSGDRAAMDTVFGAMSERASSAAEIPVIVLPQEDAVVELRGERLKMHELVKRVIEDRKKELLSRRGAEAQELALQIEVLTELEAALARNDRAAVDGVYRYLQAEVSSTSDRLRASTARTRERGLERSAGRVVAYSLVAMFVAHQVAAARAANRR